MKNLYFLIGAIFLFGSHLVLSEKFDAAEITPYLFEQQLEDALREFLGQYDPIYLPSLPTISIQPPDDPRIDITITLSNISLVGISDVSVHNLDVNVLTNTVVVDMSFNKIAFDAGHYSAGGHLINLPFNGESYMKVLLEGLNIRLTLKYEPKLLKICFSYGQSEFALKIRKPVVYFDQLNPGTDLGQSINTMVSSITYDTVAFIQKLLNGDQNEHIDKILVDMLNSIMCK